uniref:KRAB domain-containing protein n=1 Tax=Falco tinnunculus TaxID=100819 RepID=A0A8C4UX81_FALTI
MDIACYSLQVLVTCENMAVYFSPEVWAQLVAWQLRLYREVMLDNYQAVTSLGEDSPVRPGVVWDGLFQWEGPYTNKHMPHAPPCLSTSSLTKSQTMLRASPKCPQPCPAWGIAPLAACAGVLSQH